MLDPVTNFQHQPVRTLSSLVQDFAQTLLQMLLLSLLLLGIGGLVFKAIGRDGWLPGLLEGAWNSGPGYLMAACGALLFGGVLIKRAFYRRPAAINRSGDTLVYAFLGLGLFFALRLTMTGTL